jgi:hypothetical protein
MEGEHALVVWLAESGRHAAIMDWSGLGQLNMLPC